MKISKIKITNLFGISEFEADGSSLELLGGNGTGKTSVLDAIRLALLNKVDRDYIVKNGEKEGEIFIEFDNGISIKRKPRTNMTDYKSIKQDGKEVQAPEAFLSTLFSELQLDPVKFISLDSNSQNRILLDLIEYDWDLEKIKEWFGEVPPGVDYTKTILEVLKQIAAEDGYYYQTRRRLNAQIKDKEAVVDEMIRSIPESFNAEKWRIIDLGEIYSRVEQGRQKNAQIDKAQLLKENYDGKIASFYSEKETEITKIKQEILDEKTAQESNIARLKAELKAAEERLTHIGENENSKIEAAESNYKAKISQYNEELKAFEPYINESKVNVQAIIDEAEATKAMQQHLPEFDRMIKMNEEVDELQKKADEFSSKIDLARTLPAQILAEAKLPLENMTADGEVVLINDLPVSNLSEGEKLKLCVDVARQNKTGLQLILMDGIEKLSTANREALFASCKAEGLQYIATRTTDDEYLTVIEL